MAVHSVDRFVFAVPDLAVAQKFYATFGLDVRQSAGPSGNRLDLYTFGNPHCWASVFKAGDRKQLQFVRYGIFADDEAVFRERVATAGIGIAAHPLSSGMDGNRGIWLRDPDGTADLIAFIHTPHGSDHHLVAFAKSHAPGLHHSSWDVGSADEVGSGMEQMRNAGWGIGWGVGRHVLGSNFFNYVEDPWGSFCEYSAGIDFIPADLDWPAADHPPEDSMYVWGPTLPENFITNQEQPRPA